MKKIRDILDITLVVVILCLVMWAIFFRPVPKPKIEYKYTTTTSRVPVPYEVHKPYPVPTPPQFVTVYEIDSTLTNSLKILIKNKNLIIVGLRDSIKIHENYLKQFPSNPKLIHIDFKRDSFQMGLLEIFGYPSDYTFPIDLNFYSYRWNLANGFTRIDVKPTALPPTLKKPFANYFVGGAVDIWNRMPQLTARVEKQFSSTRFYIDTHIGLLNINKSYLSVGVEYQINGKINP